MIKTSQQPIGIFDSGIGGTSIWKEIHDLMPYENTIYLSDSLNAPYGQKSKEEIIELSIKNTELLINKGCKIIVVACNTATTNAIDYLRKNYNIPFIGIEPAIKPAAIKTNTGNIGILATKGTLNSHLFERASANINDDITIVEQVGQGLVELIEAGYIHSEEMTALLNTYLQPMIKAKCDYIVLGCTHYPYLIPQIKKIVGNSIQIIDSGLAVAKQTKSILSENHITNTQNKKSFSEFYINKDKAVLLNFLNNYSNTVIKQLAF